MNALSCGRTCWGLFLLLGMLLVAGCQSVESKTDRLARFTDEVLFGGPYDVNVDSGNQIVRWSLPLRVEIKGSKTEAYRPEVQKLLVQFAERTAIDTALVDDSAKANITVWFVENPDFLINREYVDCYARINHLSGQILSAEVHISRTQMEQSVTCLAHELFHVFGLRYHSGIARSVLSPAHGEGAPIPWDDLALRVLYDERLEPGVTRDLARPVIREIVAGMI
jgi:hypothetical protein